MQTNEIKEEKLATEPTPPKAKKSVDVVGIIIKICIYGFCIGHMVLLLVPYIWAFLTTFKSSVDFRYNMFGFPESWEFENYLVVLQNFTITYRATSYQQTFTFADMLWNSLSYAAVAAFTSTMAQYLVAYAAVKFKFKFSKFLDGLVLFTMTIPIYGTASAELQLSKDLNIIGNFWMVSVVTQMSFLGMSYFIIQACLRGIPAAFSESAEIDGAGNFRVLFTIYIPLTFNIILTLFILGFIGEWNSYGVSLILLPNRPVAAYGLWKFKGMNNADVAHVTKKMTACFLLIIPVLVMFLLFHEKMMGSISLAEGIKE